MEKYTRKQMLETSISILARVEQQIREKTELVETFLDVICETSYDKLYRYAEAHRMLPHLRSPYQLKEWEGTPFYAPHEILGFIRKYYSEDLGLPGLLRSQKNLLADIEEYVQAIATGQE